VSPVVLNKAGVRYEARPEFVAVLGVIPREKIEEWARQSAQVRKARQQDYKYEKRDLPRERETSRDNRRVERKQDTGSGSSNDVRRNETYNDRDRRRRKGDVSSDSDSEVLWDESDTTEDDRHDGKSGYRRDKYVPRNRSRHDRDGGKDDRDDKGEFRSIPIIVPPPSSSGKGDRGSMSSTVQPKPILKNRNTNHVRFDPDGPKEFSPEDMAKSPRLRDGDHRHRHTLRDDRDRSSRRDRDRDHDRSGDRHHHHQHHGRDRDRDRDRDKDRDRDHRREDKATKKSAFRETLGAVGIGGAAASLLSVLTEAAADL
jgi:hypothetical protein